MLEELRLFYDTRHKFDEGSHEMLGDNLHLYTDKALLQREAIKVEFESNKCDSCNMTIHFVVVAQVQISHRPYEQQVTLGTILGTHD